MIRKPSQKDYPEYYQIYIDSLPDSNILDFLEKQTNEILDLYRSFSEEKLMYKYAEDKWSVKEVLGHLLDSEIILGYRALAYARKDKTNLPMYDHDEYVKTGFFDIEDSDLLIKHYAAVRESNLLLFRSIKGDVWNEKGITGGKSFTTSSIPYIVTGHTQHHLNVLKEKYLC